MNGCCRPVDLNRTPCATDMTDSEMSHRSPSRGDNSAHMAERMSMQDLPLVQMPRGGIKVPVERFAKPVAGSAVSASDVGGRVPSLQVGQIVTAQVIDLLSGGRYLLAVEGALLEATAPSGLTAGTELVLQVEQLTPTITLRLLPSEQNAEADILPLLRTRLPNYVGAGAAVQALRQAWQHLAEQLPIDEALPYTARLHDFLTHLLPENDVPDAEQLATYWRDGGQFYEAKLWQQTAKDPTMLTTVAEQDLKGLLLGALQELETATGQAITAELALTIRKHLDHIESQQALHLLARMHDEPFPLQIPLWLGQAFSTILLTAEHDSEGQCNAGEYGDGRYQVLFLLDLDGLGQTRIVAQTTAQALRVTFYIEQQEALPVLREELPTLEKALAGLGFAEVFIEARPLVGLSPEQRQAFDAGIVPIPSGVNLIDVQV